MKQLNNMMVDYLNAMPCGDYRLQIVSFMGDNNPAMFPAKFEIVTGEGLMKRLRYLKYRNWQGFNIYCRPNSIEYVLVDDLERKNLRLASNFKPCLLMETSPDNFQAFFRLKSKPKSMEDAKVICSEFTRLLDGDFDADNPLQPGRLPGFTNRKEKYKSADGHFPYIILHGAEKRYTSFSPKGGACLTDNLDGAYNSLYKKQRHVRKAVDRSREDFRIACEMVRGDYPDEEIYHVLSQRDKGRERGKSYIKFTIKNAHRAVRKYR
jgi:hypothetical protein